MRATLLDTKINMEGTSLVTILYSVITLAFAIVCIAIFFFVAKLAFKDGRKLEKKKTKGKVCKMNHNPVISPELGSWKSEATFNPAAIIDQKGKVHMLYRAIGQDGVSKIGYTSSEDALTFDDHIPYPVFVLDNPRMKTNADQEYNPLKYPSGGSWSGSEDPRAVIIEDKVYVTFNAFDGWDYIRVGVISIKLNDFLNKRFNWSKPQLISPFGEIHKNWTLFPKKINGRFAILHSINPEVQIEYVENFDELAAGTHKIDSRYGQKKSRDSWDSWIRSAGPPPIETQHGWLILYHAVNKDHPHQYRLGAMLLDKKDPTKVIARAPAPIIIPDQWYENDWKPGIVYACGAVIKDGNLFIYYGGGDKYVCGAHTPLEPLIKWMFENNAEPLVV